MDEKTTYPNSEQDPELWKTLTPEEFIRVMLHELRNPVMVIKGYAKLLANEEATEHHPKAIEAISRNTERLEVLLKDMAKYYGYIKDRPED